MMKIIGGKIWTAVSVVLMLLMLTSAAVDVFGW